MLGISVNEVRSDYYFNLVANCLPTILLATLILLVWKMISRGTSNQSKKPENTKDIPGPCGLPIIGNAHQLGTEPYKYFLNMAQIYGDVFRIQLGSHPVVVLSGSSAIHEALINQTIEFAGRPAFAGFLTMLSVRGGGIAFTSYDEGWKIHREIVNTAFLDFSNGKQVRILESHVTLEVNEFLKFILNGKECCDFKPKNVLRIAVVNIMTNLLFSIRREFDHPDLQNIIDSNIRCAETTANATVVNFMPWLQGLFSDKLRDVKKATEENKRLLDIYINESLQHCDPESKCDILSYLQALTKDIDKDKLDMLNLTQEKIQAAVYDIYGAGYDTVSATLTWTFIYLVNFPNLQRELQDEIDSVVGRDRLPSVSDRDDLPLIEAFIAEVFRHASVVPLVVPHKTTQDTVLGAGYNYFIPKDTIVFMSLYSIHQDPKLWVDPKTFNPKRFLTENGSRLDKGKVGSTMRFGGGCRCCVGIKIAPIQLFLYVSVLLHQCSLSSVDGKKLSLNGTPTAVLTQPPHCEMKVKRR